MYTIFRWIYEILNIQFLRKTRHSVHLMYTISRWIYSVMDLQFFCKIQTVRTFDVHNFLLNIRCSGYSNSLQIQTFRTYIMYTISRWIDEIFDIQFLCKTRLFVHLMYTISIWIYAVLDFQFICKSRQSVHLMYTISRWI